MNGVSLDGGSLVGLSLSAGSLSNASLSEKVSVAEGPIKCSSLPVVRCRFFRFHCDSPKARLWHQSNSDIHCNATRFYLISISFQFSSSWFKGAIGATEPETMEEKYNRLQLEIKELAEALQDFKVSSNCRPP